MTHVETFPALVALAAAPCVVFVEVIRKLPFGTELSRLRNNAFKAIAVVRSGGISDHWKERVVPRYAGLILKSTLVVGFFLLVCVFAFAVSTVATGFLLGYDPARSLGALFQIETQVAALVAGTLYAVLRSKLTLDEADKHPDYSRSSMLLHQVALHYRPVRELAFDLDRAMVQRKASHDTDLPPVFVAGPARGGTTILLEALYSTGCFTTLTYRNMPFVTAPTLWPGISKKFYRSGDRKERAHGDRLDVNFDSPEALEEVFWLTFSEQKYVGDTSLAFQDRNSDLEDTYRDYVESISASSPPRGAPARYLAKNNNNLLRIGILKGTFPESTILVPFRNPVDHAGSLLKQHRRFRAIHRETPFALKYMNWLGHHEFGLNFKPFDVGIGFDPKAGKETETLDFWLAYWAAVYRKLLCKHSGQVVFFNYDALCGSPATELERLGDKVGTEPEKLIAFAPSILAARHYDGPDRADPATLESASDIHRSLIESAR